LDLPGGVNYKLTIAGRIQQKIFQNKNKNEKYVLSKIKGHRPENGSKSKKAF